MQKKVPELLELELQVVGSCLTWAPGTELWSSGRTTGVLNLRTISPGLGSLVFFFFLITSAQIITGRNAFPVTPWERVRAAGRELASHLILTTKVENKS